jgi:hypothetical protein
VGFREVISTVPIVVGFDLSAKECQKIGVKARLVGLRQSVYLSLS